MDKIDKKIINMLQENARATISEMSKKISVSLPAISDRVKKLEASGIIKQYTAIINPEKVNKGFGAMVFASICDEDHEQDFLDYVEGNSAVKECYFVTGPFQYCMKVFTESLADLKGFIRRIRKMGATKTDVKIMLSSVVDRPSVQLEE